MIPNNYETAVANLQRYLRRIALEGDIPSPIAVDGIYDTRTREGVADIQRQIGLEANGIVDEATWNAIYNRYKIVSRLDRIYSNPFFDATSPESLRLVPDDTHPLVTLLQSLLLELSLIYDVVLPLTLSGRYDKETEDAVRAMQRIFGLEETGETDVELWDALLRSQINYSGRHE